MKAIEHKVTHHLQPTNNTCGYASLAILLSHYGVEATVEELVGVVPQPKHENGESGGSVTAQLVTWLQTQGFQTEMYSFDCDVLDQSWKKLPKNKVLERLKASRKAGKKSTAISDHWTNVYLDAYISMLEAGAKLTIQSHVTTKLLYALLQDGPVYLNVCSTAMNGTGRKVNPGLRQSVVDDIKGHVSNHSMVAYGHDKVGNFLIADPWDKRKVLDPERLLCSITAAQRECDNQCFVIRRAPQSAARNPARS